MDNCNEPLHALEVHVEPDLPGTPAAPMLFLDKENRPPGAVIKSKRSIGWLQLCEIEQLKRQLENEERRRIQAESSGQSVTEVHAQLQIKERTIGELHRRNSELEMECQSKDDCLANLQHEVAEVALKLEEKTLQLHELKTCSQERERIMQLRLAKLESAMREALETTVQQCSNLKRHAARSESTFQELRMQGLRKQPRTKQTNAKPIDKMNASTQTSNVPDQEIHALARRAVNDAVIQSLLIMLSQTADSILDDVSSISKSGCDLDMQCESLHQQLPDTEGEIFDENSDALESIFAEVSRLSRDNAELQKIISMQKHKFALSEQQRIQLRLRLEGMQAQLQTARADALLQQHHLHKEVTSLHAELNVDRRISLAQSNEISFYGSSCEPLLDIDQRVTSMKTNTRTEMRMVRADQVADQKARRKSREHLKRMEVFY